MLTCHTNIEEEYSMSYVVLKFDENSINTAKKQFEQYSRRGTMVWQHFFGQKIIGSVL